MAQNVPVRKRIAPTPVVYTDAVEPEPAPLDLQISLVANGASKLPATRRMHVKLTESNAVNYKEVCSSCC